MKLFLDTYGKIDYDQINEDTTVKDLLDAVDLFLKSNPLPCNACDDSCCKKSWAVEMDNVSVNRLCNANNEDISKFVQNKLERKKNYSGDFYQYVLKKEGYCPFITEGNLCTVYDYRPIICRLYICSPKSYRYNQLRELTASTYLKALILEERMRNKNYSEKTIMNYKKNPAVYTKDYSISLNSIFKYSLEQGWLDYEENIELLKKY